MGEKLRNKWEILGYKYLIIKNCSAIANTQPTTTLEF